MASARADEVAQHRRLLERAGLGVPQIVAGAWPAEFGNDDPFAGKFLAQQLVAIDRLIDRLLVREIFPIRQDVSGNEVDAGCKRRLVTRGAIGIVTPDVPDFARGDGNIDGFLDPFDEVDQVFDLLLAAVERFVADHDADDVAVALGKR